MIGDLFYSLVGKESEINKLKKYKNIFVRKVGTYVIPVLYKVFPVRKKKLTTDTVICLTTYGERAQNAWVTIESLMRQKRESARIVLWLSNDEFSVGDLPREIARLQTEGLEVRFCEDLRSYKKIYFMALEDSSLQIITVDDDCIYPETFLCDLLDAADKYENTVCCYRCNRMLVNNGEILPYAMWEKGDDYSMEPRKDLVATGCGGVLYPKGFFEKEDLSNRDFYRIAPSVDDLWLKVLEIKNGYKVCQIQKNYKGWIAVRNTKKTALYNTNVAENGNDIYLKKLLEYYKIDIQKYLS